MQSPEEASGCTVTSAEQTIVYSDKGNCILGLYGDNGKENGNYCSMNGRFRGRRVQGLKFGFRVRRCKL